MRQKKRRWPNLSPYLPRVRLLPIERALYVDLLVRFTGADAAIIDKPPRLRMGECRAIRGALIATVVGGGYAPLAGKLLWVEGGQLTAADRATVLKRIVWWQERMDRWTERQFAVLRRRGWGPAAEETESESDRNDRHGGSDGSGSGD